MKECQHTWGWDIYRNPRKNKLFRKRYECSTCGKVKYSNSMSYYKHIGEIKHNNAREE